MASPFTGDTGSSTPPSSSKSASGSAVVLPLLLNRRDWNGRMPPKSKSVDRNTVFGNPFHLGKDGMTRDQVIDKFEAWAAKQPHLIARAKRELRGYNLACWCFPKRCHGLFWLRVANEPD